MSSYIIVQISVLGIVILKFGQFQLCVKIENFSLSFRKNITWCKYSKKKSTLYQSTTSIPVKKKSITSVSGYKTF